MFCLPSKSEISPDRKVEITNLLANETNNICLQGHIIYCHGSTEHGIHWCCDVCKKDYIDTERFFCHSCDFNLCTSCAIDWKTAIINDEKKLIDISFNLCLRERFTKSLISRLTGLITRNYMSECDDDTKDAAVGLLDLINVNAIYSIRSKPTTYLDIAKFIFFFFYHLYQCCNSFTEIAVPLYLLFSISRAKSDMQTEMIQNVTKGTYHYNVTNPCYFYFSAGSIDDSSHNSIGNCWNACLYHVAAAAAIFVLSSFSIWTQLTSFGLVGWRAGKLSYSGFMDAQQFWKFMANGDYYRKMIPGSSFVFSMDFWICLATGFLYLTCAVAFPYESCFLYNTNYVTGCYLDGISSTMRNLSSSNLVALGLAFLSGIKAMIEQLLAWKKGDIGREKANSPVPIPTVNAEEANNDI